MRGKIKLYYYILEEPNDDDQTFLDLSNHTYTPHRFIRLNGCHRLKSFGKAPARFR